MSKVDMSPVYPPQFMVSVKQNEIDVALPKNSGHCMVADSVKIAYTKRYKRAPFRVEVDLQTVRLSDTEKGLRYTWLTPRVAAKCLLQFDEGIKPTPFKFKLTSGFVSICQAKDLPARRSKAMTGKKMSNKALKNLKLGAQKREQRKREALEKAKKALVGPAKLVVNRQQKIVLGKTPPKAVLTGSRRQFGIRALGDLNGPTQIRRVFQGKKAK